MFGDRFFDGGRETFAVDGQRAARGQFVRVACAQNQRSGAAHFLMQKADGIVLPIIRTEGVGTDKFGQALRGVRLGHAFGAHFVEHHGHAHIGRLKSGFAAREAPADHMDLILF